MSYSLHYVDGVIECENDLSPQILDAASSLPKLQFTGDNDDTTLVTQFYGSLFD